MEEDQTESRFLQWIDRSDKIIDVAWPLGVAWLGYRTFNNPAGALYGLTAAKLASNEGGGGTFGNESRIAGLAMLAFLGAMATPDFVGPIGSPQLPHEQIVPDAATGVPTKFVLRHTRSGWMYQRAEGEAPPQPEAVSFGYGFQEFEHAYI